jgi:glycosyltransferase involved in cell wall biosynthesis
LNFHEKKDFAYFVPTHRPDRIAEGVLTFIEDRRFRERCREGGINISKEYTLERTKKDLLNFVEKILK